MAAVPGDFRRVLLRRYPYSLYYLVEGEVVVFFLLYHSKRDPRSVPRILQKRGSEP